MANLVSKLKDLLIDRVDLVTEGANQDAHIVLYKAKEQDTKNNIEKKGVEGMTLEDIMKKLDEKEQKVVTGLTKKIDELSEKVETLEKANEVKESPESKEDEIIEKADDKVKDYIQKQKEETIRVNKELNDLKEEITKGKFIDKVKKYENLSMDVEKMGIALMKIEGFDKDIAKMIEETLEKSDKLVAESGVFKEQGSSQSDTSDGTAIDSIEKAQIEVKKANPELTNEQAFVEAMRKNPELYKQYLKEQKGE